MNPVGSKSKYKVSLTSCEQISKGFVSSGYSQPGKLDGTLVVRPFCKAPCDD